MTVPVEISRAIGDMRVSRSASESAFERRAVQVRPSTLCCPGCAFCCCWPTSISILEGMDIYFHLRDSRRWTLALQERVRAGADSVTGLTYSVWLHSAIPCVFLDKTQRCEIYEARPLLCRVALSNGNPEDCKPHNMSAASGILHRTEVMAIFQNAERSILQKYNIEYHTMPIPTAILAAERIGSGELELWQAGAAVFAEHLGRF